jgi:hypothetical protein
MDHLKEKVYYSALMLVQNIAERLERGYHYRTKDGRLLTELDEVLLALTEDNLMTNSSNQRGVMYKNKKHIPITKGIHKTLQLFQTLDHTRNHIPQECHLNPTEVNGLPSTIEGMDIIANPNIPRGHIRICTATPKEVEDAKIAA